MAQKKTNSNGQSGEKKKFGRRGDGLGTGPVGQGPRGESGKTSGKDQDKGILTDLLTGGSSSGSSGSSGSSNVGNLAGNVIGSLLGGGSGSSNSSNSSNAGNLAGNLLGGLLSGGGNSSSSSSHSSGSSGGQSILSGLFGGGNTGSSGSSSSSGSTHNLSSGSSGSSGGSKFNFKTILIIAAVIIAAVFLFKTCAKKPSVNPVSGNTGTAVSGNALTSVLGNLGVGSMLGGSGTGSYGLSLEDATANTTPSSTWSSDNNTGSLDTSVASGTRDKYTKIKGGGKDTVTLMVYMCGTDLESQHGMASNDLIEMAKATYGDNVRIIVYTGGCKSWKQSFISTSTNMIFQIKPNGQVSMLDDNRGAKAMVKPETLTDFITYCKDNFKADRYDLILWDHGGGSVQGYGYDEKYKSSGAMDLAEISDALAAAGVKFDFVGFDACLMATAETALMLDPYADYMIASEESEPGVGWYYTDWLTALGKNTSISTVELGKIICDSFVSECATSARGQSTTLSVIDVAEFAATVPSALKNFSNDTNKLITGNDYAKVSKARGQTREFAASSRIDQIDLVHFTKNLGTDAANKLAEAVLGAVKYNVTSRDMTNCYGVSIYFPYRSTSYVDAAVKTYNKIGMDQSFSKCIKSFAQLAVSGQAVTGGTTSSGYGGSLLSLLGGGSNQSSSSTSSSGAMAGLLSQFLGGGNSGSASQLGGLGSLISGLSGRNVEFLTERSMTNDEAAQYILEHHLDKGKLNWKETSEGKLYMPLSKEDWSTVNRLDLSMYYDDGEGFIDLGLDTMFAFDEEGNLLPVDVPEWISVNGQYVAYFFDYKTVDGDKWAVHGHIPALLNAGELTANGGLQDPEKVKECLVNLHVLFDNDSPEGRIVGVENFYPKDEEVDISSKKLTIGSSSNQDLPSGDFEPAELIGLKDGDTLDFVADYYSYEGIYEDTYMVGDRVTVSGGLKITKEKVDKEAANMMYRFTDIYQQQYWSEAWTN
ncbi:MAG: peptidase C11 [Lachnospiraceae bacterium]|nr:peptidase C11 [Lachnospiraceae bacterium]